MYDRETWPPPPPNRQSAWDRWSAEAKAAAVAIMAGKPLPHHIPTAEEAAEAERIKADAAASWPPEDPNPAPWILNGFPTEAADRYHREHGLRYLPPQQRRPR